MDDWLSQPFVDIVIETEKNGCKEKYEPLLHRVWNGTYDICEKAKVENTVQLAILKSASNSCKEGTLLKGSPPLNMTSISGMVACAKRGGPNFLYSKRADPYTRKCASN